MPMWRCPHCGTPQAETARCWVCRRSSTACGTCRNFRRSVAGSLGYCGLDRRREPLAGDEIRACWEAWPGDADPTLITLSTIPAARGGAPLDFVEVKDHSFLDAVDPGPEGPTPAAEPEVPAPFTGPVPSAAEDGWSLWGDLD